MNNYRKLIKRLAIALASFCFFIFWGNIQAHSQVSNSEPPARINLEGTIRDFSDSHPDFERSPGEVFGGKTFKYALDRNITTNALGDDGLPVYAGGSFSTTNADNFNQWYRDVEGVNSSTKFPIALNRQDNGIYRYENTSFFPINARLLGNEGRDKNFHFTYQIHTAFTYQGGEEFLFSGDDDVWVYLNGYKVVDIGGVHSRKDGSVKLDDIAEAAGMEIGNTYDFDFFFAERHTTQSNFIIETTIELESSPFAD